MKKYRIVFVTSRGASFGSAYFPREEAESLAESLNKTANNFGLKIYHYVDTENPKDFPNPEESIVKYT